MSQQTDSDVKIKREKKEVCVLGLEEEGQIYPWISLNDDAWIRMNTEMANLICQIECP